MTLMAPLKEQDTDDAEQERAEKLLSTMAPPADSSLHTIQEISSHRTEYERIIASDAMTHMNAQASQLG